MLSGFLYIKEREISVMFVWSILSEGDGPLLAFKNFGHDLRTDEPKDTNDQLVEVSAAVARSCIANSTIKEMLSGRELIRQRMNKEMSEVVKHWGIKIEAVELNNVVIMDVNLFKDFQVAFRE